MEFKSKSSEVKLEETKLIAENSNLVFKFIDTKYSTIDYDKIKGFRIVSWKPIMYIFYLIGLTIALCFFKKTSEVVINGYYVQQENPLFGRIILVLLGISIMIFGYFFNKKFGHLYTLNVKYFEGKNKTVQILTAENEPEVINLKKELERRITK